MSKQLQQAMPKVVMGKIWPAALLGGALSVAGNLLVLAVAGGLGLNLQVTASPGSSTLVPLQVGPVVLASLLVALPAAALLLGLARFLPNPWSVFLGISGVFLLLGAPQPSDRPCQRVDAKPDVTGLGGGSRGRFVGMGASVDVGWPVRGSPDAQVLQSGLLDWASPMRS